MTCFSTAGGVKSSHKNMRSCIQQFVEGWPNYQFHQIHDIFKKLAKYSFATNRVLAPLALQPPHVSDTSQQRHLAGPGWKHERMSSYKGIFLLGAGWKERPQAGNFFWRPPDAKHWAVYVSTLEFQYHLSTPWCDLFFLPTVSAGFQAGELGDTHFGLGRTPVKWCENVGKMRNLT